MKVMGFVGTVRNDQFVDAMFDVALTNEDRATLGIDEVSAILCITYDKFGKCIIVGVLDGSDIVLTNLTGEEINQLNSWIDNLDIVDEVKEIFGISEKVS